MTTHEVARVYETLLSAPGLDDAVRIDMKIPRRQLLIINHILNLPAIGKGSELLQHLDGAFFDGLKELGELLLERSALVEFNKKLMRVGSDVQKS